MIPILGGPRYRTALKGIAISAALFLCMFHLSCSDWFYPHPHCRIRQVQDATLKENQNRSLYPSLPSLALDSASRLAYLLTSSLVTSLVFGLRHKPHADLRIPLRILPLGDSITWGWHPDKQEEGTNGYRAQMLHELTWAFYQSVDLVGTQHSGLMFDNDNEGHVDATIGEVMTAMKKGLETRPNVVLVHVGTTDLDRSGSNMWKDAPTQLGNLLDSVLEACPDAVVLVAKLIQARKQQTNDRIRTYNDAVPKIVEERARKGFKIRVVDHSVVGTDELADDLHPSYAGYWHMAMIWVEAIKAVSREGLITPPVAIQS